jgi:hypothetical protein
LYCPLYDTFLKWRMQTMFQFPNLTGLRFIPSAAIYVEI